MAVKKTQHIVFGLLIVLSLIAILVVILLTIKITPLKVYTDKQFHFSLKYPKSWTLKVRPENGAALAVFIPPVTPGDKFAENVNITIFDLSRRPRLMELKAFTKENTRQILGMFGKYVNVYESKQIRMGGLPAYRLAYITMEQPLATDEKMKYLYAWTIKGRTAFIVTFVGERGQFDEHLPHVNRMIRTFKFEKKNKP